MTNPNPMHSRCGLKGCGCEYTIGKLMKLLVQGEAIVSSSPLPRLGKFWLPNFLAEIRYTIAKVERERVK